MSFREISSGQTKIFHLAEFSFRLHTSCFVVVPKYEADQKTALSKDNDELQQHGTLKTSSSKDVFIGFLY